MLLRGECHRFIEENGGVGGGRTLCAADAKLRFLGD